MPVRLDIGWNEERQATHVLLEITGEEWRRGVALLDTFEKAEFVACMVPESHIFEKLIALEMLARKIHEKDARDGVVTEAPTTPILSNPRPLVPPPAVTDAQREQEAVIGRRADALVREAMRLEPAIGGAPLPRTGYHADRLWRLAEQSIRAELNGDRLSRDSFRHLFQQATMEYHRDRQEREASTRVMSFRNSEWTSTVEDEARESLRNAHNTVPPSIAPTTQVVSEEEARALERRRTRVLQFFASIGIHDIVTSDDFLVAMALERRGELTREAFVSRRNSGASPGSRSTATPGRREP